jgi:hypothetical protein
MVLELHKILTFEFRSKYCYRHVWEKRSIGTVLKLVEIVLCGYGYGLDENYGSSSISYNLPFLPQTTRISL